MNCILWNCTSACRVLLFGLLFCQLASGDAWGQGIALPAAGPINQSMGGASTAAPLDSMGALFWNPASISGLCCSEMSFGLGLLLPTTELASTVPAGGIFPGFPPVELSGSTQTTPGVMPIPTAAYVHRNPDSPWTYGIGIFGIGGFCTNYPTSQTNPILTPPPPGGIGLGRVFAQVEIMQVTPTLAYAITDRLSIGVTPTLNLARFAAAPQFLAAPDDANGDTFATYPDGTATNYSWGAGVHLGVFYAGEAGWNLGASIKSPQWFEPFRANANDENNQPRLLNTDVDFPMIVSLGVGYTGFERWVLATDFRYLDYKNTEGFRQSGFNPDGSVGLGWKSVFALATGAQYQLTDCCSLRAGYSYNQNPISSTAAFFNVASPLITQHMLSVGGSYQFNYACTASVAYTHAFENRVAGPITTPLGQIPGSVAASTVSADALLASILVRF